MIETIADRCIRVLVDELGWKPPDLSTDTRLDEAWAIDELDRSFLVWRLEEEFGVSMEDEDVFDAQTVDDVVALVERGLAHER